MVVMVRTVGGRYPLAADLSWHSQQNSRNFHKFLPSPSLLRRPRVAKWWWRASFCALCWGRPPVPIKTKARKLVASGTSPEIGSGFRFAATKKNKEGEKYDLNAKIQWHCQLLYLLSRSCLAWGSSKKWGCKKSSQTL